MWTQSQTNALTAISLMLASARGEERHAAVSLLRDAVLSSSGTALAMHNAATLWSSVLLVQLASVLSSNVRRGCSLSLQVATMAVEVLSMLLDGRMAGVRLKNMTYGCIPDESAV